MVIKQGKEAKKMGEIKLERSVRIFKVYDCPVELINKYISYAKLHFGNQVWKVMEKGMNLIMNEQSEWKVTVDTRLKALEDKVFEEKEEQINTFGGERSD